MGEEENAERRTPNAQCRTPEKTWTLSEIVAQLEACNYECGAGPLKNNVAFIALKKLAKSEALEEHAFMQGYVCAVANIINTHDEPTIAKDVLRGAGHIDWKVIDEYDRDILAKAGLAPRRRHKKRS